MTGHGGTTMARGPHAPSSGEATEAELQEMTVLAGAPGSRRERVARTMRAWQERIVHGLERLDGEGVFERFSWDRPGGGGGRARVIEGGRVFERGGVNVSAVHGESVPASLAKQHPGTEGKPFFASLIEFITSTPVMVLAVRGPEAIGVCRTIIGKTDGKAADPGTIRGEYGISKSTNLVHGSDSPESAKRELDLWFDGSELHEWQRTLEPWIDG